MSERIRQFKGDDPISQALEEFYHSIEPGNSSPYVPLKLHLIRPDMAPPVSLYIKRLKGFRLFREKAEEFSGFHIQSILDAGIDRVFVGREEADDARKYLETFLLQDDANIPSESQMSLLRCSSIRVTEEIFQDPSPENIRKGLREVTNFVNVLVRDPGSFYYLILLQSHDPYTYQHSVGVGLNSIALGKKAGLQPEELIELGISGLLHDIGKSKVNPAIINKPGPLNDEEWKEMRTHPEEGYEILKDNPDISERAKEGALYHHEDLDGNGYPKGLKGNEIMLFAKIVQIADIFNALTTDRTYSKAMPPFKAFELMKAKMSHKFDPKLFAEMIRIYGGDLE